MQIEPNLVAGIIFHPSYFMITIAGLTLHFSLISINSKGSSRAKYINGASIRMDRKNVKEKVKMVHIKVKTVYKSLSYVLQY